MAKELITGGGAVASNSKNEKKTAKATRGGWMNSKKSKPKAKSTHPPTSSMVNSAIESLKERSGSSLPAIKKYLAANYKVNVEKLAPFIKKYLKGAVASGKLIQTRGTGASGSFALAKKPAAIAEPTMKAAGNSATTNKSGIEKKKKATETSEPDAGATKKTGSKKAAAKK